MKKNNFLPVSIADMTERGWGECDFIYVIGEAYVDHPSFGHAIISRVLEQEGFKVGIISLPDWHSVDDFKKLNRPRLGVLVSAGNIDSMVNHYTVSKKKRSDDAYAPYNKAGQRPDRATIVYCNRIREAFGDVPIIIGGVEASLRRFTHYDYWDDKLRRSILFDSKADILIYGMGERQIREVAYRLNNGLDLMGINGTCIISKTPQGLEIPSFEACCEDKKEYAISCKMQNLEQNPYIGKTISQKHGDRYLIQYPPAMPLETEELDDVYDLPYMRTYHPMYEEMGGIKALDEVKFSLSMNRGCYGNCNFCALAFHQGRIVTSRSDESLIREAKLMIKDKDFKGYIHDVGGPTANFRERACKNQHKVGACKEKQCLFPKPCPNMEVSHKSYLSLLRKLRNLDGVKKVFIRSGIRFDYIMADKDDSFFTELCKYHISGQLRTAPEHISDNVLNCMGKPLNDVYEAFSNKFYKINNKLKKKQYIVPYLMSSHPASSIKDAIRLAEYLNAHNINPEQVQDFYPTPGTISTCMYYTGINPVTMEKVYVPKTGKEKAMQRALLQFKNPENYKIVYEALIKANRQDLIGYSPRCLIKPPQGNILNEQRRTKNGTDFNGKRSFNENKGRTKGRGKSIKGKRH